MARPRGREQESRARAFVASLAELGSFAEAASASRLHPRRVLRLLDEDPQFRAVAQAVLVDRREAAA